jgi:cobalt-zinc-cadmium efflux system protein
LVIIASTWSLLKNSLRLSLDGVPDNVNLQKVKDTVATINGVVDFHHLHIWAISTTQNALTGHLVVSNELSSEQVSKLKHQIKHELEHLNIQHATLETETEICAEEICGKKETHKH